MLVALAVIVVLAVFGKEIEKQYKCLATTMQGLGQSPISSFMLVNASSNTDVTWVCGQNIGLSDVPSSATFRVYGSHADRMTLVLSGPVSNTRTELIPPYSLYGDNDGDYAGTSLAVGDYVLSATAYNGSGVEIGSLSVEFTIQA
jgi:hypothetical protein